MAYLTVPLMLVKEEPMDYLYLILVFFQEKNIAQKKQNIF
jgi:hypothetical protein